jgi:hypothetical protein
VFLEIVTHSWDISGNFETVSEANASNLADSGVRLLWGLGSDFDANTTLERSREITRPVLNRIESTSQSNRLRLTLETLPMRLG